MAGAMLVMVVGIALAVAASVGNLMICPEPGAFPRRPYRL